ncbi:DNA-binding transcriptional regulator, LysR family [Hymenobacter daecheongensis DSM 21074]|uniref:DNA-binding transcriptional regulator, LysR family n=1 Tax=Hymenobacter daecheongensis DSM 21074 TaxID=1121955 RepID=A0A1M6D4H7_9BACT|nr:LysR substrate-binding domain-containing protein [Hymenobacter daecheongensis]SHI67993.1 DNA-binding transcriptional regulator, LysR family [Hymenobacter daecheongensis DSM 21074]
MPDFRLRVFQSVARHLSFTKAAQELYVTQPAITKHIRELERQYGQRLFERRAGRVSLTEAGRLLLLHADQVEALHQQLTDQLHGLHDETAGRLRLGASTTLAQYVIPAILPAFQQRYPHVGLTLLNANSEQIAEALLHGHIDLGFVEGQVKTRDLHYELLLHDELLAVRKARPVGSPAPPLSLAEVLRHPLVLRERGSGTLEVLEFALRAHKIKLSELPVAFYLDNTEAIKAYLEAAPDCVGFVSRRAIAREVAAGELEIVPVPELHLPRRFEAVWVQGQPLSAQAQRFLAHAHRSLEVVI